MRVKRTDIGSLGSILHCPECDRESMHQMSVDIWQRFENSPTGTHTFCEDGKVLIDNDMKNNPSPSRGGLSINFYCSHCGTRSQMDIFQHRHNTYERILHQDVYNCSKLKLHPDDSIGVELLRFPEDKSKWTTLLKRPKSTVPPEDE